MQSMTDSKTGKKIGWTRRRARRGVSLIEILIVLVILVVGILTIIRLFPSGFFSVESVGNAGLADSLGIGTLQGQTQNSGGLPDAILPGSMDSYGQPTVGSLIPANIGAYDPDRAENLDNAHVIYNETMTVPSVRTAAGVTQSIYVVSFGPLLMGNIDPTVSLTQLPMYVSINGLPWAVQANTFAAYPNPKDLLALNQPNYLVDYSTGQIALPYEFYPQTFVMTIRDANDKIATVHLTVPSALVVTTGNPSGPLTNDLQGYQPSTGDSITGHYNGNWFDPTDTTTLKYDTDIAVTLTKPWKAVGLYRPFVGEKMIGGGGFTNDPYEFMLPNANLFDGTSMQQGNIGAISFNPLGAGRIGVKPLKAQITYQNYSWRILHEDRDIPALAPGNTTVARLTLKNLRRVGDARPDNTIDSGLIPGSNVGFVIQDLDTGLIIARSDAAATLNDEDTNGTVANQINLSYATGRITFPDTAFSPAGSAHHVRIYYAGDAQWTVAVQKAPSFYGRTADVAGAADPMIRPGHYALDPTTGVLYFPRCDAGKTVTIEGITAYTGSGTAIPEPNVTVAVGDVVDSSHGTDYVTITSVGLGSPLTLTATGPGNAYATFSAVRGLSARAVVAWKERDRWKVHTVDTFLTKPQ